MAPSAAYAKPFIIQYDMYTPKPAEEPHHCKDGTVEGPYDADQARSDKTKEAFEKAAKDWCVFFHRNLDCAGPDYPSGKKPQYSIHCAGDDDQAQGAMSMDLTKEKCKCPKDDKTASDASAYTVESDSSSQNNYTLEEIVEALSDPSY